MGRTFSIDPLIHLASSDVDRAIRVATAEAILTAEKQATKSEGGGSG